VGRGPDRIRTYSIEDLVIVRSFESRKIIKAMRQHVLEGIVQNHTGATVVSVHSDISTKSGEWLDVFVLDRDLEEVQR
jgi:uncharacterized protein YbcI